MRCLCTLIFSDFYLKKRKNLGYGFGILGGLLLSIYQGFKVTTLTPHSIGIQYMRGAEAECGGLVPKGCLGKNRCTARYRGSNSSSFISHVPYLCLAKPCEWSSLLWPCRGCRQAPQGPQSGQGAFYQKRRTLGGNLSGNLSHPLRSVPAGIVFQIAAWLALPKRERDLGRLKTPMPFCQFKKRTYFCRGGMAERSPEGC